MHLSPIVATGHICKAESNQDDRRPVAGRFVCRFVLSNLVKPES